MAVTLLEELNKPNKSINFSIDLGFKKISFSSSYRKRFFKSNYFQLSVKMFYNSEELNLFETFFNEQLDFGKENFICDFGIGLGEKEYIITEIPTIQRIENDYYEVSLKLLQKNPVEELICGKLGTCLSNLIKNLNGINTGLTANIEANYDKKVGTLCLYNLSHMIFDDINEYSEKKVLTLSMLEEDF